jgi:predicted CoA-binding protein
VTLKALTEDFLAQKRIAVAGVSRTKEDAANLIYRKLRDTGHEVFPVNPNADVFEGNTCYPDVKAIPGGVDGVVIVTKPEIVEQIVHDCAEAGVRRVWMHNSFMGSSVSPAAVQFCKDHNITVIAGACPMMYCQPVDFGHKCMRWMLGAFGRLPR